MSTAETKIHNNYGLHLLKFIAIYFQIDVHAQSWLSRYLLKASVTSTSQFMDTVLLLKGGCSMLVPITAGAVLRLSLDPRSWPSQPAIHLKPYIGLCIFLALVESVKQALTFSASSFFSWDALHLIAVCLLVILFMTRYSIGYLWALMFFIPVTTPLLYKITNPLEVKLSSLPIINLNWLALSYIVVISLLFIGVLKKYLSSSLIDNVHKRRGTMIFTTLWIAITVSFFFFNNPAWMQTLILQLPLGILTGTQSGNHIWGLFPWASLIFAGFLVYDAFLNSRNITKVLLLFFIIGFFLLLIFFIFYSESTVLNCSAQSRGAGFNGRCFNRTPQQILLVLGLFFVLAPICYSLEKMGLENSFFRAVSKSILWIYVFETSVMVYVAKWWASQFDDIEQMVVSFTLVSHIVCYTLAYVLHRFLPRITIQLKKERHSYD